MNDAAKPQEGRPREEDKDAEAGREPRKGEQPLSDSETGHPDAGGLAGQGGMTDAD